MYETNYKDAFTKVQDKDRDFLIDAYIDNDIVMEDYYPEEEEEEDEEAPLVKPIRSTFNQGLHNLTKTRTTMTMHEISSSPQRCKTVISLWDTRTRDRL